MSRGVRKNRLFNLMIVYYGYKCLCCDTPFTKTNRATVDHVIPFSKGGSNYYVNLQPLCDACNVAKDRDTIDYRPYVPTIRELVDFKHHIKKYKILSKRNKLIY